MFATLTALTILGSLSVPVDGWQQDSLVKSIRFFTVERQSGPIGPATYPAGVETDTRSYKCSGTDISGPIWNVWFKPIEDTNRTNSYSHASISIPNGKLLYFVFDWRQDWGTEVWGYYQAGNRTQGAFRDIDKHTSLGSGHYFKNASQGGSGGC